MFDPIQALSLARTALDDPLGLPDDLPPEQAYALRDDGPRGLAIQQIDAAIGALYFEPVNDARGEAVWVLKHLGRLLARVADELPDPDLPSARFVDAAGIVERAGDLIDEAIGTLGQADE